MPAGGEELIEICGEFGARFAEAKDDLGGGPNEVEDRADDDDGEQEAKRIEPPAGLGPCAFEFEYQNGEGEGGEDPDEGELLVKGEGEQRDGEEEGSLSGGAPPMLEAGDGGQSEKLLQEEWAEVGGDVQEQFDIREDEGCGEGCGPKARFAVGDVEGEDKDDQAEGDVGGA